MARNGSATRERILDAAQELVLDRGFSATTVDSVLASADVSKGAFFHHFPSKDALGRALVERHALRDVEALDEVLRQAEGESDDPAEQVVGFVRRFEELADRVAAERPGCLYVSFVAEKQLVEAATSELITEAVLGWRERLAAKLRAAAAARAVGPDVDATSLADLVFTTFEGGFILSRALDDPTLLRGQLEHLRRYLTLLFRLDG